MKELMSIKMIENDAGEIDLTIDPDDVTGAHFDQLVQAIAQTRTRLQPPVPEEMPWVTNEVAVAPMTRWFVSEAFPHGPVLGLRHPGIGWSVYQLPDDFPQQVRTALDQLAQATAQIAPKTSH